MSSGGSSTSTAATSTRAVMTLSTGTSANDRAELMSSPRSAVSSPSSVMFSMMSASSSSVTVTAGSVRMRRAAALPKAVSMADRG